MEEKAVSRILKRVRKIREEAHRDDQALQAALGKIDRTLEASPLRRPNEILAEAMAERDHEITTLQAEATVRLGLLEEAHVEIARLLETAAVQADELSAREDQIASLTRQLAARDQQIAATQGEADMRLAMLHDAHAEINRLQKAANERLTLLEANEAAFARYRTEIEAVLAELQPRGRETTT